MYLFLLATSVHKLAEAAGFGVVDGDTPVVVQGDVRCNSFFVILSGSVSVHVLDTDHPSTQTLKLANITLPTSSHRAYKEAQRALAYEISTGRGSDLTEDELYIRHEHRLHLPFVKLGDQILDNVDEHFGKCVTGNEPIFGD